MSQTVAEVGFGAYLSPDGSWATNITNMQNGIGRKLDMVMDYQNWSTGTDAWPTPTFLSAIGSRPLMWTVQPSAGYQSGTEVNWQNMIAGDYDSEIIAFANWVNTNYTAAPVMYVRFAHEMNGSGWYDWQVGGACGVTSGANYAAGFNHVATVLKAHSSKILMVFAPNNGYTNIASFYPSQCDIIGFDAYNYVGGDAWYTSSQVYATSKTTAPGYDPYDQCCALDPVKPIWCCETACQDVAEFTYNGTNYGPFSGVTKSGWVETFFGSTAYPRLAMVVWFNIQKERQWQWNSSTDAENGFTSAFSAFTSSTGSSLWNPATGALNASTPSSGAEATWTATIAATMTGGGGTGGSGMSELTDTFPGTTLNPQWTVFGGPVTVSNGLSIPISTSGVQYAGVYNNVTRTIIGNSLYAKVGAGNQTLAQLNASMILYTGTSAYNMGFYIQDGSISAGYANNNVYTYLHSATYNSTSMAWLKIAESAGTIYFDTSPDGITWTLFTSMPDTTTSGILNLSNMVAQLEGSASGTMSSSSAITYGYVNTPFPVTVTGTVAKTWTATIAATGQLIIPGAGAAALSPVATIKSSLMATKKPISSLPVTATINASMTNLGKHQLLLSLAPVAGTDTFGNTYVPGLSIYQAPAGIFIYTGPPAPGNLIFSTAPAGFVDPVGNVITAGLQVGLSGSAVSADLMGNLTVDGNLNVLGTITGNSDESGILAAIAGLQTQTASLQNQINNLLAGNVTIGGRLTTGDTISSGGNVEGTNSSMTGHTDATEVNCVTINGATIPCAVVDSISDSGVTASEVNDVVTAIIHSLKGAGLMT